jgi:hypothetical protein
METYVGEAELSALLYTASPMNYDLYTFWKLHLLRTTKNYDAYHSFVLIIHVSEVTIR